MATKPKTLKVSDIKPLKGARKGKGATEFAVFGGEETAKRLNEYDGRTIYIVKLERKFSDKYGDGFIVSFKDMPGEKTTYNAGVFGEYPCKQLENVFVNSHDGKLISLDSPVKTTIEAMGQSYKFT